MSDENQQCRTMGDVIDRYMREIAPTKAQSTYKDNIKQSKYLRAAFGKLPPSTITKQSVYQYMDARGKRSQVQANRELALFSHMFKKAIRWGVVSINPCEGVERFKEIPRDRYIEDWEYRAFRGYAGPLISAYMDFKLLTGLRKGDILAIRLDQLKADGIHVHFSKTNRDIIIEWTEALRDSVESIRVLRRQTIEGVSRFRTHLFSTRDGKPYTTDGFSSIWQRKMKAAIEQGILKERFTDHDLRAKSGSDTDIDHAVKLLTHLDRKTTQRHYQRKPQKVRPLR